MDLGKVITIGIAGGSGSGKSTITDEIIKVIGRERIAILHQDAYYRDLSHLSAEDRSIRNFDHPDSIEYELLIQHVSALKANKSVLKPIYDFKTHLRTTHTTLESPRRIVLVEGVFVLAEPKLRKLLDIKIFVDTENDIRFIRRMQRDINERGRTVEMVVNQYYTTVRPMHLDFVEPSKRHADFIIPDGGYNHVAINIVTSHIANCLSD